MNQTIILNEKEQDYIRSLANKVRRDLGYLEEAPIGNDMFNILDNLNIYLIEFPIHSDGDRQAFSAAMMYTEKDGSEFVFIGLNSADYYDKQIFALAHELYHYYTKKGSHLSRIDREDKKIEVFANRFAAEFLLPETNLKKIILNEFNKSSLQTENKRTILRFIARLQCIWWLPYRSLVRRLKEIDTISQDQYNELYLVDERNQDGEYYRIGQAINHEVFTKLNKPTNNTETSQKMIELIIRNFEDNIINEDTFVNLLKLFNKTPEDYGLNIEVFDEELDEFDDFFVKGDANES